MPNRIKCFSEIYETVGGFLPVLVEVLLNEGVEGVDVVCSSMFGCESCLTLAQDVLFTEEVLRSAVEDAAEELPQGAADTKASATVWVKFISIFRHWCDNSFTPEVRAVTNTENEAKSF